MKVLVVIDNIIQYDRFKNLIKKKNRPDLVFDFKHSEIKSAIWEHPDFENNSKSTIDVKKDVEYILNEYELVLSIHCFQYFPDKLVNELRCINIHPGYNPINRGWYPQVFAIVHELEIGATIHEMDTKLDNGPIICRAFVPKTMYDTSKTIYDRVLLKEIELLSKNFDAIFDGTYNLITPEPQYNYFTKKDFNALKEINLEQKGTFKEFYNLLRALTHGNYRNAFFIDEEGNKVFLSLNIEVINDQS